MLGRGGGYFSPTLLVVWSISGTKNEIYADLSSILGANWAINTLEVTSYIIYIQILCFGNTAELAYHPKVLFSTGILLTMHSMEQMEFSKTTAPPPAVSKLGEMPF